MTNCPFIVYRNRVKDETDLLVGGRKYMLIRVGGKPNARRSGPGETLFRAAEHRAADHGYTEIASDTEIDNQVGLQAHLALGFGKAERQICFRKHR